MSVNVIYISGERRGSTTMVFNVFSNAKRRESTTMVFNVFSNTKRLVFSIVI
jgi:hypothetical protein